MRIALSKAGIFRLWLVLFPTLLVLWYFPHIDFYIRVATFSVAFLIIVGSLVFGWKLQVLRWLLIVVYGSVSLFLVLPCHRSVDRSALRSGYCTALQSYLGCRYIWGGEGHGGIDCSGLVRKGLEDALVDRGIITLDPALVRTGISLYWQDTTAKVIGEGYGGKTYTVTTCPMLNSLDYSLLVPGDLAVTVGGEHILAYLGNRTWIAADPGEEKVVKFTIPEQKNAYFFTPMKIVRWKVLTSEGGT